MHMYVCYYKHFLIIHSKHLHVTHATFHVKHKHENKFNLTKVRSVLTHTCTTPPTLLQVSPKLLHFWVAFLLNHYAAHFQEGRFGVLFHQTTIQELVLLLSTFHCCELLQVCI